MFKEVLSLLGILVVIALVLFAAYAVTRLAGRTMGGTGFGRNSRSLQVLERVSVGKEQQLLAVRLGERYFFLGCSPGGITLLEELTEEEKAFWAAQSAETKPGNTMAFGDALRTVLKQKKDGKGR